VVTGSVTTVNVSNSYSNTPTTVGDVAISSLTARLIAGLTITAGALLVILLWIYRNQRKLRQELQLAAERRRSSIISNPNSPNRSRSNSNASSNGNSRPRYYITLHSSLSASSICIQ
jgi:hypothetical protein